MLQSVNLPICGQIRTEYHGWEGLRTELTQLGLDGIEGIWAGEPIPTDFPPELMTGYHLTFFSDWLDFFRADESALCRKYGSLENARRFYGGREGEETILQLFRDDLRRAELLGADYVVFHVSDVSVEECYTYRWRHTDREVIDAGLSVLNALDVPPSMELLVENQWWPGFTFRDPAATEYLLANIRHPNKGIMLDTGHLMNTDLRIRTQQDGIDRILRCIHDHGSLSRWIHGLHLHQSCSGAYVRMNTGSLPADLPTDPVEQFSFSYSHILNTDRHRPWTNPGIGAVLELLQPRWVTHELAASGRQQRARVVRRQLRTLADWTAVRQTR